jgi:hypothetical protein
LQESQEKSFCGNGNYEYSGTYILMINTRLIDEIFDTGNCQNYILSIQCSLNGFSFLIYDTISNKFIAHIEKDVVLASPYELKVELDKFFKSETILNQSFKKVIASYLCIRSVLVPQFLGDKEDVESLMEISFEKETDEVMLMNDNAADKSKMLFSFPGALYKSFKEHFPSCIFVAPFLPVINYGMNANKTSSTLFVARFFDILFLLLLKEKKIHFLNQFYVRNDTDCLYYMLNAARQLNLDQTTELNLLGRINQHSVLVNSLRNYFEKVEFVPGDKRLAPGILPPTGQEHYLIPQIELTLCE